MTKNERNIFEGAIYKYGEEAQINMLIEEMAELTIALSHYKRGRKNNVTEEIADVQICLNQIKIIFGETEVDINSVSKLHRLKEMIRR